MSNSLKGIKGRLKQFDSTIQRKDGHGGAKRVKYKYRNYNRLIRNLYVSVNIIKCNVSLNVPSDLYKMGEVAKLEYVCLAEFVKEFKRLPEFNDKKRSPKK